MRRIVIAGLIAAATLVPQIAQAQSDTGTMDTSFRGIRIEGDVGGDRFRAEDGHHDKLGYGATVGFDGVIADRIVIGAEASYWRPNNGNLVCQSSDGGALCQRSSRELGAAVRVGYLVSPRLMVFGKGGYVNDRQRNSFLSSSGLYYVDGNIVGPGFSSTAHYSTDGYQVGGGVELSLTKMFYVSGQFVYSRYDDHTSRQRAMFGAGIRFK
jgi:outer membrane immunogenic protein